MFTKSRASNAEASPSFKPFQETLLLLLISVNFMWGVMRQLSELGGILVHRQRPLFQMLKLLQLDNSLGNTMCTKSSSEFWLVDALGLLMGFHINIPPIDCRTRELMRS
jgi:hypothetical protein